MDANKIKFIDDDGSVEVLEPPMTARVHVETLNQEENTGPEAPDTGPDTIPDTIEEESSSDEDIVVVSSSAEGEINDISSSVESISNLNPVIETEVIEDLGSSIEDLGSSIEKVVEQSLGLVEQHVKDLEKMESVIASSIEAMQPPSAPFSEREQGSPEIIKIDEVKVPEKEEIDKEALSIVANAVQDIRAEEHKQITPKGCCILQ
jgi:hypothetical protein